MSVYFSCFGFIWLFLPILLGLLVFTCIAVVFFNSFTVLGFSKQFNMFVCLYAYISYI